MDVAVGLPNTVPGTSGDQLIEWAKKAEAAGFSSLSTIDRIAYPNLEPLISLAAAGAVTKRIKLATTIAIVPYRLNAALLAKQAASVQRLSDGRLVLGLAAGGRENDYAASRVDFDSRNRRFEQMVDQVRRFWADSAGASGDPTSEAVGPDVGSNPPKLILGGYTEATFKRVAKYADGFVMGGGTPDQLVEAKAGVEAAWQEAGRDGTPYIGSLAYWSLGDQATENANAYLKDYYAWLGETADVIADSAAKDADTVRGYQQAFEQAGCGELFWMPSSSDPEQVDLLAAAAL
jgi:alkanesulfonate monooxygenase SsuD/methylene tetrahydromethanopterin reductase-like flavin-dependent oxidoreductase (luciferase family)